MTTIGKYDISNKEKWDNFISQSRNGTFLFKRDYMEYHSDRFNDLSLIIFDEKDNILAVLPGNVENEIFYTHQGLTYGGFITNTESKLHDYFDYFSLVNSFLAENNIKKVIYKKIPYIYSEIPSEEDKYCLFRLNSNVIACGIASTIRLNKEFKFNKSRKSSISKARRFNLEIKVDNSFDKFWNILNENLKFTHGAKPVHNLEEIEALKKLFPEDIKLYSAYEGEECIAGVVIYDTKNVIHVQYISASERGKEISALDFIFDKLIKDIYKDREYFDFGTSTEDRGKYLNEGLIFQKEGFGARGICYEVYEYCI